MNLVHEQGTRRAKESPGEGDLAGDRPRGDTRVEIHTQHVLFICLLYTTSLG